MKKFIRSTAIFIALCILLGCSTFVNAKEKKYNQGDIITFGSYPQSQVTNKNTIKELNKQELEWTDFSDNFYDKDSDELAYSVIYSYADTELQGEKYRAIKYSDVVLTNRSYLTNDTLWFKYEPIEWVIIDPETGYILCEDILDMQKFKHFENLGAEFNSTTPAAQWDVSDIRIWLNDNFYNSAFNKTEQKNILQTKTINENIISENEYEAFETTDNIVLFSLEDVFNAEYGIETFRDSDGGYYQAAEKLTRGVTEYVYAVNMFNHKNYEEENFKNEKVASYYMYKWFLRKTTVSQRPAEVYFATEKMSSYWVCDPITGENLYCDTKEGTFCSIDHYDLTFASNTSGIVPAMHIDLQNFDKKYNPGDIDCDASITASDARLTLRASVGLETLNEEVVKLADVDKDGTVTASDARLILRAAVGLEDPAKW